MASKQAKRRPAPKRARTGPAPNASESEIAALIAKGLNNSEIARALHVDRKRVAKVRGYTNTLTNPPKSPTVVAAEAVAEVDTIKAIVRLELSQEETLNEFSDQLQEYTQNYRDAMRIGDQDGAQKWAVLRLKLLEHMIKVSGLADRQAAQTSPAEVLAQMSDEEVEQRARAILARRQ